MNIFFLHMFPIVCAQMHCDKHVVKMILETCQMLCSVWHIIDPEHKIYTPVYKLTHKITPVLYGQENLHQTINGCVN